MMQPQPAEARAVHHAAMLAFVTHALAGALLALVLRHGLASEPDLAARVSFVASHAWAWRLSWLAWSAAALAIFLLSVRLARAQLGSARSAVVAAAPLLVACAVAADLSGQVQAIVLLPEHAQAAEPARFASIERLVTLLSGVLANGLYTLGIVLLAWGARDWLPRWASLAAAVVGVSGAALSGSAGAGFAQGVFWSTAALMPALLAWLWAMARAARARSEDVTSWARPSS
jgi:hypothetical protein